MLRSFFIQHVEFLSSKLFFGTDGVNGAKKIWHRLSADVQDSKSTSVPRIRISDDSIIRGVWPSHRRYFCFDLGLHAHRMGPCSGRYILVFTLS